ncbi:MAG: MBL fold metallo-hydrolase [Flavobacteriaceae bacterium]|jgi:L-ascorbate metabolism protein UlaG (beta-lactamase superfamily)|nr:MBL fold metallo-hydrolase [Flavobacteriaceae bacterium]
MQQSKGSRRILKLLKQVVLVFIGLTSIMALIMIHPQFGKRPSGKRLEQIKSSAQYRDGKFQNSSDTPQITQSIGVALWDYLFGKSKESKPKVSIPSVDLDMKYLLQGDNRLVWLGHSSYFMKLDGKNILVDPVLSGSASPIPGGVKAFEGSDVLTVDALPLIDYLFISHDHYDHMDYKTLVALQHKVKKVIVGLGIGSHLEHWGYQEEQIIEKDWWDTITLDNGFEVVVTPARHFSGRSIWTANTLWASFVLRTPSLNLYIGGDSGYDKHFKEIGDKYGPFDMAVLENGQYDASWKYIHMMPEEVVKATKDLNAKVLFPVHSSKFVLANHAWYEPLDRVSKEAIKENQDIVTPMIGEVVEFQNLNSRPTYWWKK